MIILAASVWRGKCAENYDRFQVNRRPHSTAFASRDTKGLRDQTYGRRTLIDSELRGRMVLFRLRSGLPTHLCSPSFKGQGAFSTP